MFGRANRLTKTKDIEKVFKQGKACYTDFLGLKALSGQTAVSRSTVVVSTKVSKRAVERNIIKRQIRAALKSILPNLAAPQDLIILALPAIKGQPFPVIEQHLQQALKRLGLL